LTSKNLYYLGKDNEIIHTAKVSGNIDLSQKGIPFTFGGCMGMERTINQETGKIMADKIMEGGFAVKGINLTNSAVKSTDENGDTKSSSIKSSVGYGRTAGAGYVMTGDARVEFETKYVNENGEDIQY